MITIPGKIPIRIHPLFWVLMGVIGWINSGTIQGMLLWAVVIFFSVLIHEFGHALTALAFGQKPTIELVALGGITHREGKRLRLWKEFIIVLNGPLAGFLLFLGTFILYSDIRADTPKTVYSYLITITMFANLFWTVVNLLPVQPLDGGRLLSIILESLFGMRGLKASFLFSGLFSVVISLLFFATGAFLAGAIFMLLAFESYRGWRSILNMTSVDQNDELQENMQEAEKLMKVNPDAALGKFLHIRENAKSGIIYVASTEFAAQLLYKQNRFKEAYDLLESIKKDLSPDSLRLLHKLAYKQGFLQEAVTLGNRVYQDFPHYETALINASAYAALKQVTPAIGWFKRAINDGLPNPQAILNKPEFELIRNQMA